MNTASTIEIFDDEYILRKTFDIFDYVGGVYGFDVLDDTKNFLFHIDGEDKELMDSEIKWRIYRSVL